MRHYLFFSLLFVTFSTVGCGENIQFGGKVTFPDGSAPPKGGRVVFATNDFLARAPIQADGTYRLASLGERDGLPPGTYQVAVQNIAIDRPGFKLPAPKQGVNSINAPPQGLIPQVSLIDKKYQKADTSGLVCEVKRGGSFDIVLELSEHGKKYVADRKKP